MKSAIVLGATGLTGGILLKELLKDTRYSKIKVFSRSPLGFQNLKMEEHLIDLFELEKYSKEFRADEVYCCVGSTKKKTPDEEVYRKVDYGIPVKAARLAKENNIGKYLVISALGADPESKFFYNRTKGEMERDVLREEIPGTYLFQPSLIGGKREEKRTLESLFKKIMKLGNLFFWGPLKQYRTIHPAVIASAMIKVANEGYGKNRIPSDEIMKTGEKAK